MLSAPPTRIDKDIRSLLSYLNVQKSPLSRLKLKEISHFRPEIKNCHINNMVQCKLRGGSIQFGWVLWEDKRTDSVEAEFHSVWKNPKGELIDITPRQDNEKKILFITDPNRQVSWFTEYKKPAIKSFSNVCMKYGKLLYEIREVIGILDTKLLEEYELFGSNIII